MKIHAEKNNEAILMAGEDKKKALIWKGRRVLDGDEMTGDG